LATLTARAASPNMKSPETPAREGWNSLNMEAQAVIGELQLLSGDINAAQRTFQKSLDLGMEMHGPRAEIAAQSHYRNAEIALSKGDYADARRNLEIMLQRYPDTTWAEKARPLLASEFGSETTAAAAEADAPFVPAMHSSSPDEALARLRAAIEEGRTESALAEAHSFLRRYPSRPEKAEVNLAIGGLHLRRGEAAKAVHMLKPLTTDTNLELRGKALHLIGAALTTLGLDEATLKLVPEADAAAADDRWLALSQVWRAAAEENLGRESDAAEHYRAVSASGHASPVRAYALAAIAADWDRQGKSDRARDSLKRAQVEAAKWGLSELSESAALSEAHLLMRARKLEDAADAYAAFASRFKQSPLRAQALYQRGLCLKKLNLTEMAVATFEDLAAKHPTSVYASDAHLQLGQLYAELGNSERALGQYQLMAKTSDSRGADREALLLMAQVHYNKKRWADALPLYKKYLKDAPPDAKTKEVGALLVTCTWQANKNDPELPALLARYPDHPLVAQIRWDLAAKAYKRGDWAGAEELFDKHIDNNPHAANVGEARFYRAECLRQLGRIEDAADAYRRFLSLHQDHPRAKDAGMRLGAMLYEAGDASGAAAAYGRVEGADAAYNRAMALSKSGKDRDAEAAWAGFAENFAAHEKASWAWAQAARLREERGNLADAADAYGRATGPAERLKSLYALGKIQEKRKKTKEAKAAYERLKSLSPKDDPARLSGLLRLALMLELEEKPQAAGPLYTEILKHAERGGQTFETARKRLESLSGDQSLISR
jgi:TolA-binding protein